MMATEEVVSIAAQDVFSQSLSPEESTPIVNVGTVSDAAHGDEDDSVMTAVNVDAHSNSHDTEPHHSEIQGQELQKAIGNLAIHGATSDPLPALHSEPPKQKPGRLLLIFQTTGHGTRSLFDKREHSEPAFHAHALEQDQEYKHWFARYGGGKVIGTADFVAKVAATVCL